MVIISGHCSTKTIPPEIVRLSAITELDECRWWNHTYLQYLLKSFFWIWQVSLSVDLAHELKENSYRVVPGIVGSLTTLCSRDACFCSKVITQTKILSVRGSEEHCLHNPTRWIGFGRQFLQGSRGGNWRIVSDDRLWPIDLCRFWQQHLRKSATNCSETGWHRSSQIYAPIQQLESGWSKDVGWVAVPAKCSPGRCVWWFSAIQWHIYQMSMVQCQLFNIHSRLLDGFGLKNVPDVIFTLTNLTHLSISHNGIIRVPEGVKNLKSLRKLAFHHNGVYSKL